MIYEMRTYDLKPRSLAEVEKRFGEAYEKRKKYSELTAFWHTEIGPLNQIIHVWPYKDLEERNRIRAAAVKDGVWPPATTEFIVNMRSEIMIPFSISPELKPGKMGPYYEMRTYTHAAGDLPKLRNVWEKAVPERLKFSPLCAAWYSELGGLNKFVHIWPYPSLDARNDTRDKSKAAGVWPPSAEKLGLPKYNLVAQENKILMPSSFSPLQ
ncbi:MAG: NIPSNAP family protein [Burkholderiales bacterium]